MHVPPGGGPPPHRHDFEEMFTVLDGEVQVTFRGKTIVARAGETINVPANAPHAFTNAGDTPSRLLCMCAPSGQEEFFTLVGRQVEDARTRVQDRTASAARREIKATSPSCCSPGSAIPRRGFPAAGAVRPPPPRIRLGPARSTLRRSSGYRRRWIHNHRPRYRTW